MVHKKDFMSARENCSILEQFQPPTIKIGFQINFKGNPTHYSGAGGNNVN